MVYVGGKHGRAARMLGMNRGTLRRKLEGYAII